MYSPKIPEHLIPRLYRAARAERRPMTRLVADAVEHYLVEQHEAPEPGYAVTELGRDLLRPTRAA
jgi:hypothetical protein